MLRFAFALITLFGANVAWACTKYTSVHQVVLDGSVAFSGYTRIAGSVSQVFIEGNTLQIRFDQARISNPSASSTGVDVSCVYYHMAPNDNISEAQMAILLTQSVSFVGKRFVSWPNLGQQGSRFWIGPAEFRFAVTP